MTKVLGTYLRHIKTWQGYGKTTQRLLLANIKRDICALLVGKKQPVDIESTDALEIFDDDNYAEELRRELAASRAKQGEPREEAGEVGTATDLRETVNTHRNENADAGERVGDGEEEESMNNEQYSQGNGDNGYASAYRVGAE